MTGDGRAVSKFKRTIGALACFGFLLGLGCPGVEAPRDSSAPKRPPGVPEEAFWTGGADGGVFVVLEKKADDPPPTYHTKIYDDRSGTLWYEGRLTLEPAGAGAIDVNDRDVFAGWDGEVLHLKDQRSLRAVDREPAERP